MPTASPAPAPDQAITALAAAWFDPRRTRPQASLDADGLLQGHAGDPQLARLSQALGAMRMALRPSEPSPPEYMEQALAAVRRSGDLRATRLAEAAWAFSRLFSGSQACQRGLELLQGHGDDDQAGLVERLCRQVSLCALHAMRNDFEPALAHGLQAQAQALASQRDFDILSAQAMQGLNFVFLSVGDVEAAENLLRTYIDDWARIGAPAAHHYYNLLLCKIVAGRHDEVARLFEEQPWLCDEPSLAAPVLPDMLALVRARQGAGAEADRLLQHALPDVALKQYPLLSNRAWIRAGVHLLLGRPQAARDEVEAFLARHADAADAGHRLTPMNATQLHLRRSEACEALGDLKTALVALRDSQSHCFSWVGDSVQARLNALHAAARPSAQQQDRHSERLAAVATAVEQARAASADLADSSEDRLQRQQRFFSHVTHEMRNPLNGVLGMTSLLMMSDLDERQRKYLDLARSSAQMLMGLCNDVLDLAKLDAGRFELQSQEVDVAGLIAETAEMLRAQAQLRGIELGEHVDPALPRTLQCDPRCACSS